MSSSDEEQLLLLLALKNKRKILCWVNEINTKIETFGEYHRHHIELQ